LSPSPSVDPVGVLRKLADWIWMPFGVVNGVGRGMCVLNGVEIVEGERAVLGVKVGHLIVTDDTL